MGLQERAQQKTYYFKKNVHEEGRIKFPKPCQNLQYYSHDNNCYKSISKLQQNLAMAFVEEEYMWRCCLLSCQRK